LKSKRNKKPAVLGSKLSGFLLGLLFYSEDGGDVLYETSVEFDRSTQSRIAEDGTVCSHR
jgi:hypothetical protein